MAMPDQDRALRFERIYVAARDPLARYLARRAAADAVEDLFAEVMTTAWRRLADIPRGDELPWLFGTARRVLANHRRASGRLGRLLERLAVIERGVDPGNPGASGADPGLAAALDSLSPADAEVLRLWAWEELAPREIALVLGTTPNAVSIRLHRAKARLRARLAAGPGFEDASGKATVPVGHVPSVERTEAR
jgi:RNA polymerase sigma-70 factor, ECF subfamily